MTSPLSSASAASRTIRRDPALEPDDQWKENLKAQIEHNLTSMVKDAEAELAENLKRNPTDSERLQKELSVTMDNIRKLATETFKEELERERHERRWATGHELPPDLAETMKKEQQAILDQIQSGKSSNTPASNDGPNNDAQESINSANRRSSTFSVSPSVNTSPSPRLSKPTQRTAPPEPDPSSDEGTDEESDNDSVQNRHIRSQPIMPPIKARDDDDCEIGPSSWEPGSINLNRVPRPYSSNTPPKPSPEVWRPPELASDRSQRRNSTASVRSTGSSRRPTVVDTIPEARPFVNSNSDINTKADQERVRIQDADQAWRNLDAAKERQVSRRRTLDNMTGPSSSSSALYVNDQPGTSPTVSSVVSSSPSQSRPPPPPLETKPIYRKTSFVQENPAQLYRKPSFVHETGPRNFDKVPIPPRSTQSHLSLSRPIEPIELSFNGDSGDSPYSQTPPRSATLAFAQAAEGYQSAYPAPGSYIGSPAPLRDQEPDTRIRSRHPSNEPRYVHTPSSAGPVPSARYPPYHNPQGSGTQAYPSPPPSHHNTYPSPPSSRPFPQQQQSYPASPHPNSQPSSQYSSFQSPSMYKAHTNDDGDLEPYRTGPSHQHQSWSGNEPMVTPMSPLPDTRHHSMRSPSGSQDAWRTWSQQHQSQTHNLRSPMSNNSLREQQIQDRYRPAPSYTNTLVDAPEHTEEGSETTDSESEESSYQPTPGLSSSTSYSSFQHPMPHPVSRTNVQMNVKSTVQQGLVDESDEDSLEHQQMLAKLRKRKIAEAAKAVEMEEAKKKELARQAAEQEAMLLEESRQREAARIVAEEEVKRQKLAEEQAAAKKRKEEEEADAQRKKEAEIQRKETIRLQVLEKWKREEERLKEEARRVEERRQEQEEKKRRLEEATKKEEEAMRLRKIEEEEARLELAKKEARKEEERRERLRQKEDDLRRRQDEVRKKEEELQRKVLEEKQREFERLEKEARRKEAEAKKREKQARLREEEARRKETEIQERERQLRLAEEELQRREKAAKEEALRREREKAEQEEAEKRERQEQERLAQEERERQEKADAEKILLQQKIQKEEQERIESEIAWKEHEKRKAEAEKVSARREEQATINRKRQENERIHLEDEAKRRERDRRQQDDEERKREAEKMAQQEEFRRREEEIRNRKRQDSAAAWESWTIPTSPSHQPQSSTPLSNSNVNGGTNSSQRSSSTASTSASGWSTKPTPPPVNPAWSKTWSASSSASASNNHTSNPPPSTSSIPTPKPRSGSTGAAGSTPLSGAPLTEEQWQRRNEEQFRAQQERFRLEQERFERERLLKSNKVKGKDEVIKTFEHHARLWEKLPEYTELRWDIFPWPMLNKPLSPEDITYAAVDAYLSSPYHPEKEKQQKDRIKEQIRKWHPDRFETKLLPKVIEEDKVRVKEGAGSVARNLNDLLTKSNIPTFFN